MNFLGHFVYIIFFIFQFSITFSNFLLIFRSVCLVMWSQLAQCSRFHVYFEIVRIVIPYKNADVKPFSWKINVFSIFISRKSIFPYLSIPGIVLKLIRKLIQRRRKNPLIPQNLIIFKSFKPLSRRVQYDNCSTIVKFPDLYF